MKALFSICSLMILFSIHAEAKSSIRLSGNLPVGWELKVKTIAIATNNVPECRAISQQNMANMHWMNFADVLRNSRRELKEIKYEKTAQANRSGKYRVKIPIYTEPTGHCGMYGNVIYIQLTNPEGEFHSYTSLKVEDNSKEAELSFNPLQNLDQVASE